MIRTINNSITRDFGKHNWIDQNNVVFGYDDYQCCCEDFGWAVYDPNTREKVADEPDGLPYHFDFEVGVKENEDGFKTDEYQSPNNDFVQVKLVSDDTPRKRLVLECYNFHNGYYYHDFSFRKNDAEKGVAK